LKNVIEMLLERKQCFEKRCKGTHYFANFQIFWDFFVFLLAYSYLCTRFIKGCSQLWAEMIPSEPDTDNAGAGMMSKHKTPYF
jgi:hypothetical protein